MFQSIQNYFATPPRRGASPLGAGLSDEDDNPAIPAFQTAWKDGALVEDLFGPQPFALHGSVGASGADNHRPDVVKVETLLGDAGYYKPMTDSGPNGWHNPNLDSAIRSFQKDKELQVDGLLKPGGPTITMGGNGKPVIVLGGRPTRPRMPDLFPGHTISEAGAREHEDWAKLLKRDAKPEETARILNVAITDHGDQGAADAADLLGRFAQHDPQKAETLRTLVSRQAGREVPFRIAPLGEGFREPSMEEKLAQAPKSPFGPTDGADMEAAGSMAKALLKKGDYQDAYAYLKSAPEATQPYMAAVHDFMRQENPGLAMKFAEQGVQNGMAKPVHVAQAETGTKTDAVPASAPPAPAPTPPEPKPAETNPQAPTPEPTAPVPNPETKSAPVPAPERPQAPATAPAPSSPNKTVSGDFLDAIYDAEQGGKVGDQRKPDEKGTGSTEKGMYQINNGGLETIK